MEDFLPVHGFDTMDIAIPSGFTSTSVNFIPTTRAQHDPLLPDGFTVNIEKIGSGFIIALPRRKFLVGEHLISALIVTAAHVVTNVYTTELSDSKFICYVKKSQDYCIPIKHFLKDPEIQSKSSFNIPYMCSNDLAIFGLVAGLDLTDLRTYPICSDLSIDSEYVISGFPSMTQLDYIYPNTKKYDKMEIRGKIFNTFCEFEGRINSYGNISNFDPTLNLGQIKCSTTSGMSGSPVMKIKSPGCLEICGVYVGGPPLELQYQVLSLVRSVVQTGRYDPRSIEPLHDINRTVYSLNAEIASSLNHLNSHLLEFSILGFISDDLVHCANSITRKVVSLHPGLISDNQDFYFNSFFPITHPYFQEILRYSKNFSEINRDFLSTEELLAYLNLNIRNF